MKITNIKLVDEKFVAEVELTQKQLDFITSVGIGVLLQAGANMVAMEKMSSEDIFDDQEEKEINPKVVDEAVAPAPAVDNNELN